MSSCWRYRYCLTQKFLCINKESIMDAHKYLHLMMVLRCYIFYWKAMNNLKVHWLHSNDITSYNGRHGKENLHTRKCSCIGRKNSLPLKTKSSRATVMCLIHVNSAVKNFTEILYLILTTLAFKTDSCPQSPLTSQIPAHILGKEVESSQNAWPSSMHKKDPERATSTWLWPGKQATLLVLFPDSLAGSCIGSGVSHTWTIHTGCWPYRQ